MEAQFERFTIKMTRAQAQSASHPGPCDDDVKELLETPSIKRQLRKISPDLIRDELREFGAWDETELRDDDQNAARIIWIAAGNIQIEREYSKLPVACN